MLLFPTEVRRHRGAGERRYGLVPRLDEVTGPLRGAVAEAGGSDR
jgi:hypothetical protein